MLLYFLLQNSG
jgi:hypothetical protein